MTFPNPFINSVGRLRSGWRFAIFILFYLVAVSVAFTVIFGVLRAAFGKQAILETLDGQAFFLFNGIITLTLASFVGWFCGYSLEGLSFKAIGWNFHKGWFFDFIAGSLLGVLTLSFAVGLILICGGYRFSFNSAVSSVVILKTLFVSLIVFIVAAASEEAAFRGYPLQTMARSKLAWVAVLILSVCFALAHLRNPNATVYFTMGNTFLAGIWLSLAYLKTRSLWLPLGLHWTWNWTMSALFGIPVSGITEVTPTALLRVETTGPLWLTGGSYGIEGGLACTLAVLISTIAIWVLPFPKPTEEMYKLSAKENPTDAKANPNAEYRISYD